MSAQRHIPAANGIINTDDISVSEAIFLFWLPTAPVVNPILDLDKTSSFFNYSFSYLALIFTSSF